jgi:hypothetical protein
MDRDINVTYRECILPDGFTGHRYEVLAYDATSWAIESRTLFKRPRIRGISPLLLIGEVIR